MEESVHRGGFSRQRVMMNSKGAQHGNVVPNHQRRMEESVRLLCECSIYIIHHSTYYEFKRGATGWCRAKPPKEDGGAFAGCTAVNSRNASGNFLLI
jgi:hypothetical protein